MNPIYALLIGFWIGYSSGWASATSYANRQKERDLGYLDFYFSSGTRERLKEMQKRLGVRNLDELLFVSLRTYEQILDCEDAGGRVVFRDATGECFEVIFDRNIARGLNLSSVEKTKTSSRESQSERDGKTLRFDFNGDFLARVLRLVFRTRSGNYIEVMRESLCRLEQLLQLGNRSVMLEYSKRDRRPLRLR